MLKKKIIFGSVVLLLAALFALTGCSQATDSDGGSTALYSENHLFGTADYEDVDRAVASAKSTGRSVVLTDQLKIVGTGTLPTVADFGDVPVRVEGSIRVIGDNNNRVIVNAARSTLSFAQDATITVEGTGTFIYNGDGEHIYTATSTGGFKVKYMPDPLINVQGTDRHIAVPSFQLGPDFSNVAPHVTHLYILDKITVNAASRAPGDGNQPGTPRLIALGEVDLTENNSTTFGAVGSNFTFTADSILTSSAPGNVTLGLPDLAGEIELGTVKGTTPITILGPGAGAGNSVQLTINRIEGPETVTISDAAQITDLSIGTVVESGKVDVRTPEMDALGSFFIGNNAGSVSVTAPIFDSAVTISGQNTGSLDISTTGSFTGGLGITSPNSKNAKAGTITITSPDIAAPGIVVTNNEGTINLNTGNSGQISGGVRVAENSGVLNLGTPLVTSPIAVTTNTGEINFTRNFGVNVSGAPLTTLVANFLKVPANKNVINFMGSTTASVALGSASPDDSIAGSGKIVFGGPATLTGATIIACDTEFTAGLSATAPVLDGNVTLAYEQGITLATSLTLGAGKQILVGTNPVFAAGRTPVIINITGILRAGTELPGDADDPATFVGNKTLALNATTSIGGNLLVPGVLRLGTNGAITSGSLTLADGGILAFAATNVVTLGNTTITGSAAESRLTASGGTVTLGANSISGNGATLAVVPDMGDPIITVDPTGTGNKLLTIEGVNLDLLGNGSLVIKGHASANRIILANGPNPGKLTLSDTTAFSITNLHEKVLECGPADATLFGNGVVRGDNEVLETTVGDLAALPASSLTIIGAATDVEIAAQSVSVRNP
ncbi:hypothetical protein LQZ21_07770 [Treponema sp. TIM-1]|uniref:beta strand repeat-containing protein n=1 Tax=Treponema sp. TIM-1 TaxID=2898417 RepID=UPI0039807215